MISSVIVVSILMANFCMVSNYRNPQNVASMEGVSDGYTVLISEHRANANVGGGALAE